MRKMKCTLKFHRLQEIASLLIEARLRIAFFHRAARQEMYSISEMQPCGV